MELIGKIMFQFKDKVIAYIYPGFLVQQFQRITTETEKENLFLQRFLLQDVVLNNVLKISLHKRDETFKGPCCSIYRTVI